MFGYSDDFDEKFSLKYPSDKIPKDYDVSKMLFTFDFIYLVYKREASIDKAVESVAFEYGLHESYLMDYFVENKFILNKMNRNQYSDLIKQYNTKSLKKILKNHGLKTSGKRERIEERILENNLLGNDYYLSSKSKVFYKNKKRRVKIFNEYLVNDYFFDEFNEYYMDNFRKKEKKIPLDYVNVHINKAIEEKNHHNYVLNVNVMAKIYHDRENYKKMLENVLKIYCINLNPVWKIDDLDNHYGFALGTYNQLLYLNDRLGKNRIITAYFAVWDSFNFEEIIVSKYVGYRYLKSILNNRSYSDIIRDLDEKFYSNKDLKIKKIVQKTLFDF